MSFNRKAVLYLVIAIFVVSTVLAGCSSKDSNSSGTSGTSGSVSSGDADKKTKLSFAYLWTGTDSKAPYFEPELDRFREAHPEIELEAIPIAVAEYEKQILIQLASESLPDVFLYWNGTRAEILFESDALLDLTDFLTNDEDMKDRFYPVGFNGATKDGKIYGAPAETVFLVNFANRKLFEKFDLPIPETYEELKHVAEVFRENDIVPIAASARGREFTPILDMILMNLIDTDTLLDSVSGNGDIDRGFEKAAEYIKEMNELKMFPDSVVVMPLEQVIEMYNSEQAAMFINGNFHMGSFSDDVIASTEIIPFPAFAESDSDVDKRIIEFPSMSYFVNADIGGSDKVKAAEAFIKYMTRDDFAAKVFTEEAGIPVPNKADFDESRIHPVLNKIFEVKGNSNDSRARIIALLKPAPSDALFNSLQSLLTDSISPEQFYDEINQAFNSVE